MCNKIRLLRLLLKLVLAALSIQRATVAEAQGYFVEETLLYDLDDDNSQETIERIFVGADPSALPEAWVIRIKSGDRTFESEPIAKDSLYSGASLEVIQDQSLLIALWYATGAYSYGVVLLKYSNGLEIVNEIGCDGLVFSDKPINFEDVDNDEILELKTISRDWDNNPVKDKTIEIYKYNGERYELYSTESTKTGEIKYIQ